MKQNSPQRAQSVRIRPTRFIITSRTGTDTGEQCVSLRPCVLMKTQAIALIRLVNMDTGAQSPIAPLGIDLHSRRSRLAKTASANLYDEALGTTLAQEPSLYQNPRVERHDSPISR